MIDATDPSEKVVGLVIEAYRLYVHEVADFSYDATGRLILVERWFPNLPKYQALLVDRMIFSKENP